MPFIERFATFDFNPVKHDLQGYFWDFPSLVVGQPRFNRGVYDSRFLPGRQRAKLPTILEAGIADLGDDPKGIGPALVYGKIAAEVLDEAFWKEDFTFKDYKRRLFTSPLGHYLLYRWCVAWVSYRFSWSSAFMHALWTVGQVAAALWPKPAPLYPIMDQEPVRKSGDQVRDYAD